jgi:hypothetical protein
LKRLRAHAGKPFMREDSMARKTKRRQRRAPKEDWIETDFPVVGVVKDCRQISKTHWEGIDVEGTVLRVRGILPAKKRLIVPLGRCVPLRTGWGYTDHGLVRLIPAAALKP